VSETRTDPKLQEPDTGSPDDRAHYARREDIVRAAVDGGRIRALCGVEFEPIRDPSRFPVCQRCAEILNGVTGDN
jgi:Protein of unknown function (DUF3039)